MKKFYIALFLTVCVLLSACGFGEPEATTTNLTEATAESTTAATSSAKTTEETTTAETATEKMTSETTTENTAPPETTTAATTEAPKELYYSVYGIPGVYRLESDGSMTENEAAEILVKTMLDQMCVADESRAFCLLEYSDVEITVHPSADALTPEVEWGILSDSPVIADNTYLVYIDASFRYSGIYAPIGPSIDENRWWTSLGNGIYPLVLLETENGFLMWWECAYGFYDGNGVAPEAEGLFIY